MDIINNEIRDLYTKSILSMNKYIVKEDSLLTEIANISSVELKDIVRYEFHSARNGYHAQKYLDYLERVKNLCLKGYRNDKDIIRLIKTGADNMV